MEIKTSNLVPAATMTIGDDYKHTVLLWQQKKEKDERVFYVHLNRDTNRPFKVSQHNCEADFNMDYWVDKKLMLEIEKEIEFEDRFAIAKKTDVRQLLREKFVKSDEVGELLNASIRSEKNILIFGKGGYGKSEMMTHALKRLDISEYSFIKSFGEGLSDSELYGGTNIKVLKDTGKIEYNLVDSFVENHIVIFEELFDAPPIVLTYLKDTLTSGFVRNGRQQYPIKCKIIIGLTNKQPSDVAKDDSRKALLERFHLQKELYWESHNKNDYAMLLRKTFHKRLASKEFDSNASDFYLNTYTDLVAKASKSGEKISPRVCINGFELLLDTATNDPRNDRYYHFQILKFISGLESIVSGDIMDYVKGIEAKNESQTLLNKLKTQHDDLKKISEKAGNTREFALVSADATKILDCFSNARFHDNDYQSGNNLLVSIQGIKIRAQEHIVTCAEQEAKAP